MIQYVFSKKFQFFFKNSLRFFQFSGLLNGNNNDFGTLLNGCLGQVPNSREESVERPNSTSTPNPSRSDGLIDSKAMRKATCQICNVKVCSTARQRHVYMVHIKQPDMFMCSGCDYTNSNSIWEMRKHCIAQHSGAAEAISNEEKHKELIQVIKKIKKPQ